MTASLTDPDPARLERYYALAGGVRVQPFHFAFALLRFAVMSRASRPGREPAPMPLPAS